MLSAIPFLLVLMLFGQGTPDASNPEQLREAKALVEEHRQEAIRINDLASHLKTESDAEALVDSVAEMFADSLPSAWATQGIRHRFARAEFAAANDPGKLIPEQRVTDLWNQYVTTIGAGSEAIVSVSELHSLRDGQYSVAKYLWLLGSNQSIWTMPNIFAVGSDGKVATGCRPLEALRVFYDLDNNLGMLTAARKALKEGRVLSDEIDRMNRPGAKKEVHGSFAVVKVSDNPVRSAEYRYVQEHGSLAMDVLLKHLSDEFLPK
jgi:hypothetical protein